MHSLRIDELMNFLHSSFNSRQQEKQEPQQIRLHVQCENLEQRRARKGGLRTSGQRNLTGNHTEWGNGKIRQGKGEWTAGMCNVKAYKLLGYFVVLYTLGD